MVGFHAWVFMIHIYSENHSYVAEETPSRKRIVVPETMIKHLDQIRDDSALSEEAAFRKWMAAEEELEDMFKAGIVRYAG